MKMNEVGTGVRPGSILEEMKSFSPTQVTEEVIDSRANHIIQSVIHMFEKLDEMYDERTSHSLKRRFISSINNGDPKKFSRAILKLKERK